MPGAIFVITAPSGTGKTTLLKPLMAEDSRLQFSISYTTRPPRSGEINGKDYFFVSPNEFECLRKENALVEWVEQFGYGYGTSRDWLIRTLDSGADLVFDLDSRGARAVKNEFPQATLIFILPPSLAELERRLRSRGSISPQELARRLENGRAELKEVQMFEYVVINDDIQVALAKLKAIVQAARCRTSQIWPHLAARYL